MSETLKTITCRHCAGDVVPKVIRANSGLTNRFCPLCGECLDDAMQRDVSHVRVPSWVGYLVIIAAIAATVLIPIVLTRH